GLVRISEAGSVDAVADLAALISLCAQLQAEGSGDDGPAWAATAAALGTGRLEAPRGRLPDAGGAPPPAAPAPEARGARPAPRRPPLPLPVPPPPMLAFLLADTVPEAKHVLLIMLIVGLIFIGVITLGELAHSANKRRKARPRQRRAVY